MLGGTTFNGRAILAGNSGTQTFQVGANTTSNDRIDVVTTDMTADADITAVAGTDNTGAGRAVIDNTAVGATIDTVIANIDTAVNTVNTSAPRWVPRKTASTRSSVSLQISVENQSLPRAAASLMPTLRSKRPTSPEPTSSSRQATR